MSDVPAPFSEILPGIGSGTPLPDGWKPVAECSCLIFVGLTGVGKSTVLARLAASLPAYTLLPDRRVLTDRLIISRMQQQDGAPVVPVADRQKRFEYTRRYRKHYPGGMSYALSQVALSPEASERFVVFDGLRGENEIWHAAQLMPQARFVMLDAPDIVRIRRLLSRGDSFDSVTHAVSSAPAAGDVSELADLGIGELATLLTLEEQRQLLAWLNRGSVEADDLVAKSRIVLEERRSYDPAATRAALAASAGERSLILDTVSSSPEDLVRDIARWLGV